MSTREADGPTAEGRPSRGRVLVMGFGNPARADDGLGPAVAAELESRSPEGVTVDSDYQLTVEDSAQAAEHDVVVFVDAAVEGREPFSFTRIEPERQESFSSHSVSPQAVMGLAEDLFGASTPAYMLAVRGYSFDMFQEELTEGARENMRAALDFLQSVLETGAFEQAIVE